MPHTNNYPTGSKAHKPSTVIGDKNSPNISSEINVSSAIQKTIPSQILTGTQKLFTPIGEAIEEIHRRRNNPKLQEAVLEYLNHDIPELFIGPEPIMYLSRHVATPNYEAIRFIEIAKPHNLPMVIGQDNKGVFVTNNPLKRALGKMPIVKGITRNQDEIIENFTIVDFKSSQGKPHREVFTYFNEDLVSFHNDLLNEACPNQVSISEESEWIDRHFRNNIIKQYEHLLALVVSHGIMFESYPPDELSFVEKVMQPAYKKIFELFGYKPLIVELINDELELERNWNSYPSIIYPFVKNKIDRV